MALVALDGSFLVPIGPVSLQSVTIPGTSGVTIDAVNEGSIVIGYVVTADGGSHTIDTTGLSSLGWRSASVTFANGGTTVKVGLAAVDSAAGPPARAVNTANVITFDVSRTFTGGGGGITADAWQTHVPDAGTKTVANGDLIAFAIQMTARGGTDSIGVTHVSTDGAMNVPCVTNYIGGSYLASDAFPDAIITFSDGVLGWFYASDVGTVIGAGRTWNSSSATKEYGQLYKLPFPLKIYGLYGWAAPSANYSAVLYSDPLGTPVAEKTISIDANVQSTSATRKFVLLFPSPYTTTADQNIGIVLKPGASNISLLYKTLASATHRVTDPWGTDGYGISRASGAFADANSSLDHYYIGLLVGAFDAGGIAGRSIQINNDSLVG